ncbi:hypothetical protein HOLleu_30071 [Holothuria leucospilota]|uniref:Uncharacterized protein n=1 Tax=Holothuria leucospilota TaxID=206669 RepID=A0A9Q1BK59_HOLLE|nr:hypothetical protein HOLleu_30071 [Holothuria leucospilota]
MHDDRDAKYLQNIFSSFGLTQHVNTATHQSGHTLDLILSRSTENILVELPIPTLYVSDHCFLECGLSIQRPAPTKEEFSYRKYKSIDIDQFKLDILSSNLYAEEWLDVNIAANCFSTTLQRILDRHAPLKNVRKVTRTTFPWYSDHLKQLKRKRRKAEKIWRRELSEISELNFRRVRNQYTYALYECRTNYYNGLITENSNNPRKLFKVFNEVIGNDHSSTLPDTTDSYQLACDFGEFFVRKLDLIRNEIDKN